MFCWGDEAPRGGGGGGGAVAASTSKGAGGGGGAAGQSCFNCGEGVFRIFFFAVQAPD
jgi:hypothetical protein